MLAGLETSVKGAILRKWMKVALYPRINNNQSCEKNVGSFLT